MRFGGIAVTIQQLLFKKKHVMCNVCICVCVCACASAHVCTYVYLRSACITASTESQITATIIQGTSCARLCMCACMYVYTYVDVVPVSVTPIAGSVIGGVVGVQILIVVISVFIVLQNRGKVITEFK